LRSNWEVQVRTEVSEDSIRGIVPWKVGVRKSSEHGTEMKKKRAEQEAVNDVTVASPIRMCHERFLQRGESASTATASSPLALAPDGTGMRVCSINGVAIGRGNMKDLGKGNLPKYHLVHQKSNIDLS
jgi:hypothetical protein